MNSDKPSLEQLLQDRENRQLDQINSQKDLHPEDRDILTHEGNASLNDLIEMIQRIVRITMKDLKVEFLPDEGMIPILHPEQPLNHPCIAYKVINRKPHIEKKPRVRQYITEDSYIEEEGRPGEIRGQKFKSVIQFNIFASVYADANKVMDNFEEMMLSYSYFFKKKGITDIFFDEQLTDESLNIYRQSASIRSLRYVVYTEKLHVLFRNNIEEVDIVNDERS